MGPSIKYVTLEGSGVWKGVTVCDRGGDSRACDVTLIKFLSYIWNMKFQVVFNFLNIITHAFWQKGNRQKAPRTKPSGQKTKPRTKTPTNNWERICTGGFCQGFFVLGLLKIGGSEMCDVLLGGPGMCDKVRQGRGSKVAKNSVTYFMDGPLSTHSNLFAFI